MANFWVLDVASEAYGDISISHSIKQSIIEILTVCSPILTSSSALGRLTARMSLESFDFSDAASEAYGDFSVKLCGAFSVLDVASEAYG
jgi:hypothetical protein